MDPNAADFTNLNWLAIGLSFLAMFFLGFLWYSPKTPTGKVWLRSMGMDPGNMPRPQGSAMAVSMALMILGTFAMMFVFAHVNMAYEDAFGNTATGGIAGFDLRLSDTITGAILTWVGFIVPVQLNRVAFEKRSWTMFWVDGGFYLVSLLVAAVLLATV